MVAVRCKVLLSQHEHCRDRWWFRLQYIRKNHRVEFDGFSIPHGCLVDLRLPKVVLKKAAKFGTTPMPGIFIGYTQHVGGKRAHDYFVCPLEDFWVENASHTCRIFRIREVIPDCSMVDLYRTGYIFPLRAVKDQMTRTLGPHGVILLKFHSHVVVRWARFTCLIKSPGKQRW